jgi:hypothetical protein
VAPPRLYEDTAWLSAGRSSSGNPQLDLSAPSASVRTCRRDFGSATIHPTQASGDQIGWAISRFEALGRIKEMRCVESP